MTMYADLRLSTNALNLAIGDSHELYRIFGAITDPEGVRFVAIDCQEHGWVVRQGPGSADADAVLLLGDLVGGEAARLLFPFLAHLDYQGAPYGK